MTDTAPDPTTTTPAPEPPKPRVRRTKPTARTLERLRKLGLPGGVVERYNHHARQTFDLLGFIDVVAVDHLAQQIVGIQTTGSRHHAERQAKIQALPNAAAWARSGAAIEVWSWEKQGARGARKTYQLRAERALLDESGWRWIDVTSLRTPTRALRAQPAQD